MKLAFVPDNDTRQTYCMHCQTGNPAQAAQNIYLCPMCGQSSPRALIIDPAVEWWCDDTGEYWHITAGVFVARGRGEFLFFDRTRFPFGLTIPAGHVDKDEHPRVSAHRELQEETSLRVTPGDLVEIGTDDLRDDQCRRGSDAHRWHSFAVRKPVGQDVQIDTSEGDTPIWMTLEEALHQHLTPATREVITRHRHRLETL